MPDSVEFPIARDSLGTWTTVVLWPRHQPVRFNLGDPRLNFGRRETGCRGLRKRFGADQQTLRCEIDGGKRFSLFLSEDSWRMGRPTAPIVVDARRLNSDPGITFLLS
jgi:hypothetical protein